MAEPTLDPAKGAIKMPNLGAYNAMRKQRQPQASNGKLRPIGDVLYEAIAQDAPKGMSRDQLLQAIGQYTKTTPSKLVQVGNSVFLLTVTGPGTAEVHIFSKEPPSVWPARGKVLVNIARSLGVKKLTSYATHPGVQKLMASSGLPVKTGQSQKVIGNQARPVYTFELDLGGQ